MKIIKNRIKIAVLFILSMMLILLTAVLIIVNQLPEPETNHDLSASTSDSEQQTETEAEEFEPLPTDNINIPHEPYVALSDEQKIDAMINNMTLEQKIGQMFFCAFRWDSAGGIVKIDDEITATIKDYNIGGVVLFSENIESAEQVTDYISDLQQAADITLFIGIDEEGGRVLRTGALDVPLIPSALTIGQTGDLKNAYNYAQTVAGYLKPLGFNVDFAPVADVFTNPSNTVIGDRAFSTEPDTAAQMVANFSRGLLDSGVLPTLKHFPGHGDTGEDSHYGIATTQKNLKELSECEFIPFKAGINAGTPFVMVGHISTPNITGDDLPAAFSDFLLHDVLRDMLAFDGIIITDSLAMGAVTNYFTSEETAVKSILAGVDMLLMPQDFRAAYNGVIYAVRSGEISYDRINESVKRILTQKYNAGLIELAG